MTGDSAYQRILDALHAHGGKVMAKTGAATAQCPAHEDRAPSLSIRAIEGQALVHCHAGCPTIDVLAALGLTLPDLFDDPRGARYRYDDGRTVTRTPDKKFRQAGHAEGVVTLYRLAKVIDAVKDGVVVYLVEGEKDVHALESLGAVATTAPMGATNFVRADVTPLTGAHLIVIPDQDEPGNRWLHDVTDKVGALAATIAVRAPKTGKDAADHIAAGHSLNDFIHVPTPGRRAVVVTSADTITVRPVHWLWAGRLPIGSLVLLAGREGIGKTTVAYQLAADITRGRLAGRHHRNPAAVIVAATEDSWEHTIVPRLMAAGADLTLIYRVAVLTPSGVDADLSLPTDLPDLGRVIDQVGAKLILLDPLMSRLDAELDAHRDGEVRQALEPLVALANRHGAVVLGIIHVNKSTSGDALTRIMASRAFVAVARAVLFVLTDPEDETVRMLGLVKNNLGRLDLPTLTFRIDTALVAETDEGPVTTGRIVWGPETDRTIKDVIGAADEDTEVRSATSEARGWLTDWLTSQGGSDDSADIKKAAGKAGHSASAIHRARRAIGIHVSAGGFPRRTYWALPGTQPPADTTTGNPTNSHTDGEDPVSLPRAGGHATTETTETTDTTVLARAGGDILSELTTTTGTDGTNTVVSVVPVVPVISDPPARVCATCGQPLDPTYTALGRTTHPVCPAQDPT